MEGPASSEGNGDGLNLGFPEQKRGREDLGPYRNLESLYPFLYPLYLTMVHNGGCMDINPNTQGGSRS